MHNEHFNMGWWRISIIILWHWCYQEGLETKTLPQLIVPGLIKSWWNSSAHINISVYPYFSSSVWCFVKLQLDWYELGSPLLYWLAYILTCYLLPVLSREMTLAKRRVHTASHQQKKTGLRQQCSMSHIKLYWPLLALVIQIVSLEEVR